MTSIILNYGFTIPSSQYTVERVPIPDILSALKFFKMGRTEMCQTDLAHRCDLHRKCVSEPLQTLKRKREAPLQTRRRKREEEVIRKIEEGNSSSSVCSVNSEQVAIRMEHEHMLALLKICATERNLKSRRMSWEKIGLNLNNQFRTDYPIGVVRSEYYRQYSLCRDYYILQREGFNIASDNDQSWDNIYRIIPGARAVRDAERAGAICVENWMEVFGHRPDLPMSSLLRETFGATELVLWKPSEGGKSTTGGSSRVSGGSSHNSQTVNLCRHEGASSSPDMGAKLNTAADCIRELMAKGMPSKFYYFAVDFLGRNLQFCEWVITARNHGELAGWLQFQVEQAKPEQLAEFNIWLRGINTT